VISGDIITGINLVGYVTKLICENLQLMEDIAAHVKKNNASTLEIFNAIAGLGIADQSRRMMEKSRLTKKQVFLYFCPERILVNPLRISIE
jgi:hypothetical protein